jgi:hypothetical protein
MLMCLHGHILSLIPKYALLALDSSKAEETQLLCQSDRHVGSALSSFFLAFIGKLQGSGCHSSRWLGRCIVL